MTPGIDLDSDLITDIARASSNIVGVKLSCGDVGKVQRLSSTFDASKFAVFGGRADFLLPGLFAGSRGAIAVLANVAPKTHLEVIRLYNSNEIKKAQEIQAKLAYADWTLKTLGISGTKVAIQKYFGYGSPRTRTPFVTVNESVLTTDALGKLQAVIDLELKL